VTRVPSCRVSNGSDGGAQDSEGGTTTREMIAEVNLRGSSPPTESSVSGGRTVAAHRMTTSETG
jgi:hypothetical protein